MHGDNCVARMAPVGSIMSRRSKEGHTKPRAGQRAESSGAAPHDLVGLSTSKRMNRIAATDATFTRRGGEWVGRCLICGAPLRFDAETGEGANIEHIVPRSLGGTNDLRNLGITHPRCNGEKGRNWDPKRRHRADRERYAAIVHRLLAERARRWRDTDETTTDDVGLPDARESEGTDE